MYAYLERFEEYLLAEKCVSPHTHKAYTNDIKQLILFLQKKDIDSFDKVTSHLLREFLKKLKDGKYAARTMSRKVAAMKLFCRFLSERHGFPNHAAALLFPKLDKRLPSYCTEDDVVKLLAASEMNRNPKGLRNKVLLYLLYVTGVRVSEAVNIKLSDINSDLRKIQIRGKGGKTRVIPLPDKSVELLQDYITNIRPLLMPKKFFSIHEDYLFPNTRGKRVQPLSRQAAWAVVKKMLHVSNIDKNISPHTLRHSIATHLLKSGWDIRSLQLFLGHENITTVEIYTHVDTTYLRSVYNKKHPRS